nr:DUF4307 domain-containing protein [Auraticoccus cholistanensis]
MLAVGVHPGRSVLRHGRQASASPRARRRRRGAWEDGEVPPAVPVTDPTAAERIRRRYPRSWFARPAGVATLAVLAAVVLAWLLWAASSQASPPVSGRVDHYVISDDRVDVTVSIQRPDPSVAVSCLVVAQAQNFERVGEVRVELGPGTEEQVRREVPVQTFRRAAAASLDGCQVG